MPVPRFLNAPIEFLRKEFRFTLRGMFVFTFCVACGLIVAYPYDSWAEVLLGGLLGGLTTAAVVGLAVQARDLILARSTTVPGEQRFSVNLPIAWRLSIAAVLAACCVCDVLIVRGILVTSDSDFDFNGSYFPTSVWWLCLVVVSGSSIRRSRKRVLSRSRTVINAAVLMATPILAFVILNKHHWFIGMYGHVYIALAGIETAEPVVYQRAGAYVDPATDGFRIFWISAAAAIVAYISGVSLASAARGCSRPKRIRRIFLLVTSLGVASSYSWWFYAHAWPSAVPDFASADLELGWNHWIGGVAIVVGFGSWVAISLATINDGSTGGVRIEWRPIGRYYLHERRLFAALMLLLNAYLLVLLSRGAWSRAAWWPSMWLPSLLAVLRELLTWPRNYIFLAILIFSARAMFQGRHAAALVTAETALQPVSPWRLLILFVLALLVIVTGVAAIRGLLFAWWIGPWGFWSWST